MSAIHKIKKIGVFCGSNIGNNSLYAETAELAISMVHAGLNYYE